MRGLANQRENECEHVYTTRHGWCSHADTPGQGGLKFAGTYPYNGWPENCCIDVEPWKQRSLKCHRGTLPEACACLS